MSEQNEGRTISDSVHQNKEDLEQIKNTVNREHGTSKLRINRVPDETIEKFKALAASKMANDYGLTLAYLLEIHELKEEFDSKVSVTNDKVLELQQEIIDLKQSLQQKNEENNSSKVDTIGE